MNRHNCFRSTISLALFIWVLALTYNNISLSQELAELRAQELAELRDLRKTKDDRRGYVMEPETGIRMGLGVARNGTSDAGIGWNRSVVGAAKAQPPPQQRPGAAANAGAAPMQESKRHLAFPDRLQDKAANQTATQKHASTTQRHRESTANKAQAPPPAALAAPGSAPSRGVATISGISVTYLFPGRMSTWTEPLVFGIASSPKDTARRAIIRQTWGKQRPVLFLLAANSTHAAPARLLLEQELREHGDVLLVDMEDGYRTALAYKVESFFHAVLTHVPRSQTTTPNPTPQTPNPKPDSILRQAM